MQLTSRAFVTFNKEINLTYLPSHFSHARVVCCRIDWSKLLSPVYAILLILVGIMFPMTEALYDKWLDTVYNMVGVNKLCNCYVPVVQLSHALTMVTEHAASQIAEIYRILLADCTSC